jgi:hypothetical protein
MMSNRLADEVEQIGREAKKVNVQVSYEVVKLFSEQLYPTPVKAIEELVVNSWDAEASLCSVLVDLIGAPPLIAVFDNGKGMTLEELENLWHIGITKKPGVVSSRKQIGKFGIGKLASYSVARRATYLSKTADGLHAVTMDFERFAEATDATGTATAVTLMLRSLTDVASLSGRPGFESASRVLTTNGSIMDLSVAPHWTLVVLEDLKGQARQLATGRLRWVLEMAMPFATDFTLYLNGQRVASSKERYDKLVQFSVGQLADHRLKDLSEATGETWSRIPDGLKSPSFPSGVTGDVYVTERSLYAEGGKSEDLGRSHGFFVRVHNRLINETDPLFGARPLSFTTWYRFAAVVEASDLHNYITAARTDVEQSTLKGNLRELLIQLFNEARDRREALIAEAEGENKRRREGTRDYVSTELVERPMADALVTSAATPANTGRQAPAPTWRLLEPVTDVSDLQNLVEHLYAAERQERHYTFRYSASGPLAAIARLDARTGEFIVNEDHPVVREFYDQAESKRLLENLIVAEALLEVYLHIAGIDTEIVNDLLDKRDSLLRSLALDESYSLPALASALRTAADDAADLEVALVGALRALGFTARHIGGSGTPDGVAEYVIHGVEDRSFTLEAKSSVDVPSLGHLDFSGLQSHYDAVGAQGCLLVAPAYPGGNSGDSEVARRSRHEKVSCWTIDQLADVVAAAERRHLTAQQLQSIVLSAYAPVEVAKAVQILLSEPKFDRTDLYVAVIAALADLEPRLPNTPRNVYLLAAEISRYEGFGGVDTPDIIEALKDMSRASRGMLHVTEDNAVYVLGSLEELRRRVTHLTGDSSLPRRRGTFRGNADRD